MEMNKKRSRIIFSPHDRHYVFFYFARGCSNIFSEIFDLFETIRKHYQEINIAVIAVNRTHW